MIAHLQGSPTTICHLWRIEERPRAINLHFTDKENVKTRGGTIVKNAGMDGSDDAGASSIQSLSGDGFFEFRTDLSGTVYAGLSEIDTDVASDSIEFCVQVDDDGRITIREAGTQVYQSARNVCQAGHLLKVRVASNVVTYWYDRTKLYTSLEMPAASLYADTSIATTGAKIYGCKFGKLPTVVAVCNHTRNLTYNEELYTAFPLTPSRLARAEGLSTDNAEITTILNSDYFDKTDLKRGRWDQARIELMAVNYLDLTMGPARKFVGRAGQFKLGNGIFTAEIRSLSDLLSQEIGEVTGARCRARQLGDERCGLPMDDYLFDAEIVAVTDDYHFTVDLSPAPANDFFANGSLYWRSGDNQYNYGEVKSNTGNVLTLQPLPTMEIAVGDTVTLSAGCARTVAACKGFVNAETDSGTNIENYQGEPDLPGIRKLHQFPS